MLSYLYSAIGDDKKIFYCCCDTTHESFQFYSAIINQANYSLGNNLSEIKFDNYYYQNINKSLCRNQR